MVSTSISTSEPVSDGSGSTINGRDAASETSGLDVPRQASAPETVLRFQLLGSAQAYLLQEQQPIPLLPGSEVFAFSPC